MLLSGRAGCLEARRKGVMREPPFAMAGEIGEDDGQGKVAPGRFPPLCSFYITLVSREIRLTSLRINSGKYTQIFGIVVGIILDLLTPLLVVSDVATDYTDSEKNNVQDACSCLSSALPADTYCHRPSHLVVTRDPPVTPPRRVFPQPPPSSTRSRHVYRRYQPRPRVSRKIF